MLSMLTLALCCMQSWDCGQPLLCCHMSGMQAVCNRCFWVESYDIYVS